MRTVRDQHNAIVGEVEEEEEADLGDLLELFEGFSESGEVENLHARCLAQRNKK